jgi:pretoxin HINT domain-containing protein
MSFVGGLGAKIVAKYAWRFKAAYRLGKQVKNLVTELVDGVREWKGASKALDAAKTAEKDCNSFAPGTPVLLADGSSKPIEKVELGDLVVATDPETGKTAAKVVTRLIAGEGNKNLVQVTVDTDGPHGHHTGAVVATAHHPFWVPRLHRWVDATDLQAGQWLQTSAGTWVQVTAVNRWTEHARVHNLTVDDLHTYYVLADRTPILVHNDGSAPDPDMRLYRFGRGPETVEGLSADAARAAANDPPFPHGVSTSSRLPSRMAASGDYRSATVRQLQDAGFTVEQTGQRSAHHTIHLPDPVTQAHADALNSTFESCGL